MNVLKKSRFFTLTANGKVQKIIIEIEVLYFLSMPQVELRIDLI